MRQKKNYKMKIIKKKKKEMRVLSLFLFSERSWRVANSSTRYFRANLSDSTAINDRMGVYK